MLCVRFTLSCHRLHFDVSDLARFLNTEKGGRLNLSVFGSGLRADHSCMRFSQRTGKIVACSEQEMGN